MILISGESFKCDITSDTFDILYYLMQNNGF